MIINVDVKRIERLNNSPSYRNGFGLDYMREGMMPDPNGTLSFNTRSPSAAGNVGPQLTLSGIFSHVSYVSSGKPQQDREENEHYFSGTEPEREIPFGAVVAAIFCVWIAWRIRGPLPLLSASLFLYGVIGALSRFDPYSLILLFGPLTNLK